MTAALRLSVRVLGDIWALTAALGSLYLVAAAIVVRRTPRREHRASPPDAPRFGVTILKPLHGAEPGLLRRLLSFCDQIYPGDLQIVFGCQHGADPAVAVAQEVAALRPDRDIAIVVDERLHGSNRKVSNLLHCFARARHDLLVLADSDIEVERDYLDRVVATLAAPGVGAVTCLYEGEGETAGSCLSALAINAHFLPNVLVGTALGAATPCFGSTIALRRDVLRRIGGFESIVDKLADDYAIGAAVRGLGLSVSIPSFIVRHACCEPTIGAFFRHQLRFARTIRGIDPGGHLGSAVTNPLPFALLAALCGSAAGPWLVTAALVCRLLVVRAVATRFGEARQNVGLLPFCDLALFAVLVASFCGSSVEWRGHRFHSLADGTLAPVKDSTPA